MLTGAEIESILPAELGYGTQIRFSGQINSQDLEELMSLTTTPGHKWILLFPIIFGTLIVLMNASWPWIMCAVGLALLFLVMVSLLSRSYRLSEFLAFNAHWDRPIEGWVDRSGYQVRQGTEHTVVLWSSVANAFSSDKIVAFQSALQPKLYRIISHSTVSSADDWSLLRSIAEAIHCSEQQQAIREQRISRSKAMISDEHREPLISAPSDATVFSGRVTGIDIRKLGRAVADKRILSRAIFYWAIALMGIAAIVAGIAGILLRGAGYDIEPTSTLLLVVVIVFTVVTVWLWIRQRTGGRLDDLSFQQRGFATNQVITMDYGSAARESHWSEWFIKSDEDDRIVLADLEHLGFMTLRNDMFESEQQWQQFKRIARDRASDPAKAATA